jgi:hypothetical protein
MKARPSAGLAPQLAICVTRSTTARPRGVFFRSSNCICTGSIDGRRCLLVDTERRFRATGTEAGF